MTVFKSFEDTWDQPLDQYVVYEVNGKPVTISKKNPSKHESDHPLLESGYFYHNLGAILEEPHNIAISTSNNPEAIAHRKIGQVMIYSRDNFVTELNPPGYINWRGDTTHIVVMFEDTTNKNYTLTYYIEKK